MNILQLAILIEPPFLKIYGDHLSGTQPPLLDHFRLVDLHHACLGADDQQTIAQFTAYRL